MARATMHFPPDFRWGTATAAWQVEGANPPSDWQAWEAAGGIAESHSAQVACDWWANAEADLDRAAALGTNAHRLSVEWSRIEPEPSVFDEQALARYREILEAMHARGLEPMVTLHHFSNPQWLVEKGDFSTPLVVDYFERYVNKVAESLGDLVTHWITINEPMVYVFMRYLDNRFPPPADRGILAARRALTNLLRCHAAAYRILKARRPKAQVGVAKNVAIIEPASGSRLNGWWARRLDWLFNELWMVCLQTGRLHFPLGRDPVPGLADSFDFYGLNYYTRFYARFPKMGVLAEWPPGAVVSDGNYGEVYPEGIFLAIKRALKYDKPIFITENGLPDAADRLRPGFLIAHLREVWRAISFCFPVMGYYHWTLVDNFEWERGWTQRFGLFALDLETQERHLRPSGELYGEICRSGTVSSDMTARYAPELLDTLFPG